MGKSLLWRDLFLLSDMSVISSSLSYMSTRERFQPQEGTQSVSLPRLSASAIGVHLVEISAWMMFWALSSLGFILAGIAGGIQVIQPADLIAAYDEFDFSVQKASLSMIVVFILATGVMFFPRQVVLRVISSVGSAPLLIATAILGTVLCMLVFIFPAVWLVWFSALDLGLIAGLVVIYMPQRHRKPWRSAGAAAAVIVLITYSFQIVGGAGWGILATRWVLVIAASGLAVAALLVFFKTPAITENKPRQTSSETWPGVRPPVTIHNPWACVMLFALLGAIFALAQPTVADEGFGQAGYMVIAALTLLGWAIGYEIGPTFAPGMSRPRLTSFALLMAGLLAICAGVMVELSGTAVLSGAAGAAVGIGARAQSYAFSRSLGIGVGVLSSLLCVIIAPALHIPLSEQTTWILSSTSVAYVLCGLSATVAGLIALFTFAPQGIHGIGVDVAHAFRQASTSETHEAQTDPATQVGNPEEAAPSSIGSVLHEQMGEHAAEHASATGLFIAIEGGDGAGKSTQITLLADRLRAAGGNSVVLTREPGGTAAGKTIRSLLLSAEGVSPRSEALLFAADRAQHVAEGIKPALDQGKIVITDRYADSSLAYQAAGRELSEADVAVLSRWATEGLVPHLTVILDIDPEVAASRTHQRGSANHLDTAGVEFHSRVRTAFLDRAAQFPERYLVVDAHRDPGIIAEDIAAAVENLLYSSTSSNSELLRGDLSDQEIQDGNLLPEPPMPPEDDEVTRAVHAGSEDETTVMRVGSEDETTVMRAGTFRGTDIRRLQAQAEIERQARERVRQARAQHRKKRDF